MNRYLVIVESPTKIKTLKRFLGEEFTFSSSIGHIRDLPVKKYGIEIHREGAKSRIDVDYEVLPDKKEVVKKLIKEAKTADLVYLCPDPDREGEAIAWHIRELLPKSVKTQRVTFNSITQSEVQRAIKAPREINQNLVDAQQARRILDRIVGYTISPVLVQRVQMGRRGGSGALSAGRVQSVALKLVVDREKEIEAFITQEYWHVHARCIDPQRPFRATAHIVDGKRVITPTQPFKDDCMIIQNEEQAQNIQQRLQGSQLTVESIQKQERLRHPAAPFITSTLQQEASRHHGFSATRTMSTAQQLYEGVDLGSEGSEGLITYMRTDSTRISPEALASLRQYITTTYGSDYLHPSVRSYNQKKSAQDAHEAIRPTNLRHPPEKVAPYLTPDQLKLYTLIWRRFITTQMKSAIYDTVTALIKSDQEIILKANGSHLKFDGFLKVYHELSDENSSEQDHLLPLLKEGQRVEASSIDLEQSFTKPPPRYTEASLVKALEESGIGRPSTYASIMQKIQSRSYTTKESGRLRPTTLGRVTTELLESYFQKIMNLSFTAEMEDDLEKVAIDALDWQKLISDFWQDFSPALEEAKASAHVPKIDTSRPCPKCSSESREGHLQKIWAGQSYFFGCNNYPDCDYRASLEEYEFDKSPYSENFDWEQACPLCSREMKIRRGPYGVFLGCSDYPTCKGIVQIPLKGESKELKKSAPCRAIGCTGELRPRRSRFGKIFFSCSEYPACDVIGSSLEEIAKKYVDHPKTAAQKKSRKSATDKGVGKKSAGKKVSGKRTTTKLGSETKSGSSKRSSTKKATAKKAPAKKAPAGDPLKVSSDLAAILHAPCHTRAEITKGIWTYIKEHSLQDPSDGRYILCDTLLRKVLGEDRVYMTSIAKAISRHLTT